VDQVSRRILVLFAHPSLDRSEVNRPLADAAAKLPNTEVVDLYAEYPTFHIDVDREQSRLVAADVIVFLHPLYWYSTPAILKEWQDLVLEYGFAYGSEGRALHGKTFFCVLSAGGPETAYQAEGYNHFTLRQLLAPLEQTANLCGMLYLPPFALFSSRRAAEDGRVPGHIAEFERLLGALREGRFDVDRARDLPHLNGHLDALVREV
jgi:glutathione-regulated potassium-efflux system ancillary protein KefG